MITCKDLADNMCDKSCTAHILNLFILSYTCDNFWSKNNIKFDPLKILKVWNIRKLYFIDVKISPKFHQIAPILYSIIENRSALSCLASSLRIMHKRVYICVHTKSRAEKITGRVFLNIRLIDCAYSNYIIKVQKNIFLLKYHISIILDLIFVSRQLHNRFIFTLFLLHLIVQILLTMNSWRVRKILTIAAQVMLMI